MPPKWLWFPAQQQAGSSFGQQLVSIDQTTNAENLAYATNIDLEIANTWTYSMWVNLNTVATIHWLLRILPTSGSVNTISMRWLTGAPNSLEVRIIDPSVFVKDYRYDSLLSASVWTFLVCTWDGTNMKVYHQGTLQSPTSTPVDVSGTMTNTNRLIGPGSIGNGSSSSSTDGKLHSYALWNVALTAAEVTALHNGGLGAAVDYATNGGNYTSAANLKHWWRLGFNSADIGKDYGLAATLIDVMTDNTSISAADIVSAYPGQ